MRLFEIFEDTASPANVKVVADTLDNRAYSPADKVARSAPVLDMEIPTSGKNHFIQRYNQRSEKAGFNLKDIFKLLYRAKTDPSMGYAKQLDNLSREEDPNDSIEIRGDDALTVPVIVKPNPEIVKSTDGNPVGLTRQGKKAPKNQVIPKTVFRKGVAD